MKELSNIPFITPFDYADLKQCGRVTQLDKIEQPEEAVLFRNNVPGTCLFGNYPKDNYGIYFPDSGGYIRLFATIISAKRYFEDVNEVESVKEKV